MDAPKTEKILTEAAATLKAERYCAYQERAQQEVRDKLYEWGQPGNAVERIIAVLIENNFLNEERFAKAYAHGKFNQKQWGRVKIKQGLKLKKVPDVLIRKALASIDGDLYYSTLRQLIEKKAALTREANPLIKRQKLFRYALGRGFESDLIGDIMKEME